MQSLIVKQPPSLNKLIESNRRGWKAGARSKKRWTSISAKAAIEQLTPIEGKCKIVVTCNYYQTSCDPDNLFTCIKSVLDGCVSTITLKHLL